jgi:hypothetical protein
LGVLQAALLTLVALILAFGLTLAVERYDARRAAVVETANAIGTTYLRAQTLREPTRTRSLEDLERYTDVTIRLQKRSLVVRLRVTRSRTAIACSGHSGASAARRSTTLRPTARRASTSKPSTR